MYDRAAVRNQIYLTLNKGPATKGFYTDDRCNDAVQEALDFVASEMFLYDEGWQKKIDYIDVQANQQTIPIPPHMEMIQEVRYLTGNVYTPLQYNTNVGGAAWSVQSGVTSVPGTYDIVDNSFFFNPALGVGGPKYLQVTYMRYPSIIRDDAQQIDPQFARGMIYFVRYRAATIMANSFGMKNVPWAQQESMWYEKLIDLVEKRNAQSKNITDFCGY